MSETVSETLRARKLLNEQINARLPRLDIFVNDLLIPAYKESELSFETKHLIGLAVSIHTNCRDGIVFHTNELVKNGLAEEKFFECIELCILDGGSLVYPNARHALHTFNEAIREL